MQGSLDQLQQNQGPSHAELVPDMMQEAMRDAGNGLPTKERDSSSNVPFVQEEEDEEFCFPGDGGQPPSLVTRGSDDDEEFCILGEDPGTGIMVSVHTLTVLLPFVLTCIPVANVGRARGAKISEWTFKSCGKPFCGTVGPF